MLPNKRRLVGLVYAENLTREVKLAKGFLETGLILSGAYTSTIGTGATAVRSYAMPIKNVSIIGNNGKVIQSWKPPDIVRESEVYEQAAKTAMLTVPAGFGPAAHAGEFNLFIPFASLFALESNATALPTWIYDELILRVEWGSAAEIFVGPFITPSTVMDSLDVIQVGIQDDFSALGDPFIWGRQLPRHLVGYKEAASVAVADGEFTIELPRTADMRSIFLISLDSDGEPIDTLVKNVTLKIDNTIEQLSKVVQRSLRADNAKLFGVAMPTGLQVLEFAEDKDIIPPNILEATRMTALDLVIDKAAVAGTIRAMFDRIELPTEEAG